MGLLKLTTPYACCRLALSPLAWDCGQGGEVGQAIALNNSGIRKAIVALKGHLPDILPISAVTAKNLLKGDTL